MTLREQDHSCVYCGAEPAPFGYDGKLRENRLPLWACEEHREEVKEMGALRKNKRIAGA